MSDPIANYSFLPWLRHGLANNIAPGIFEGPRPTMNVDLSLSGQNLDGNGKQSINVSRKVALFGPGDIQGIESRAIVRVDPRHWSTNFEPNYFPAIEFYDEDFLWRYTPEAPVNGRLKPWIALIVLAEGEFTEAQNVKDKPLGFVNVSALEAFPDASQLWACAHVHVNRSLIDGAMTSTNMDAVLPRFQSVLQENPDLAYSRLVSMRQLKPNTPYHAFLMPVYESGRRAGLGLDPGGAGPTDSAWGTDPAKPQASSFPYYYRWYFRTAEAGDFESLVRLLKPQPADFRVGTRDMDVQKPGINIRGVENKPKLGGVLKLGGALRVPAASFQGEDKEKRELYEQWAQPFPQPMQVDLAHFINLAEDYHEKTAPEANDPDDPLNADPDPIITLPLYGTWHARTKRLLQPGATNNWLHELNLDPRFRVAAGFGTRVVQENQEAYMDAAWEQLGKVLEGNNLIRLGQFSREISFVWWDQDIKPLVAARVSKGFIFLAPLKKRVLAGGLTVHQHLLESHVQPALTSGALRRIVRPRGRLMQSLPFDDTHPADQLIDRVNDGEVSAAPPLGVPPALNTVDELAEQVPPKDIPKSVVDKVRKHPALRWWLLLALLLLLFLLFVLAPWRVAVAIALFLLAVFAWLFRLLTRAGKAAAAADAIREENQTPESVGQLPDATLEGIDTTKFKQALHDVYVLIAESEKVSRVPPKKKLDIPALTATIVEAINPLRTIPKRIMDKISLPPRIRLEIGDEFVQAMAYPEFDVPMYKPLDKISSELFVPNLNLIPQNSVTLLETNQKFIEAYMVGLNHEFARELLWRQYPTDQRGSYFRQFWDPSGYLDTEKLSAEALREKLRDIPPIHTWKKASELGDHDHREEGGEKEEEVVLVIRGELLKRYPNPVIYAHRACWQRKAVTPADDSKSPCERSGAIDLKAERRLAALTAAEEKEPPHSKVLTPLYEAKVAPDITFFGFNLKVETARGGPGTNVADDPGWFFVIKERPGEPRFGLDIDKQPAIQVWNDLSWKDVKLIHGSVDVMKPPPAPAEPTSAEDAEKHPQWIEDKDVHWNSANVTSADLAYILLQAPVLVAFHASEMLPKQD